MVALVGYTNAGKSTVLNRLTRSDIPANDRLFDTLDTTTRRLWLPELQREILLSDTVGFIRKLPTNLIEAFKATLEELRYADLLLHVIDVSAPDWEEQAKVTDALIREGFKSYIPETTKIIIAQRVASVQDADLILVMDGGAIAASGTHEELLKTSEIYREVYESQTNGGDENA